MSFKNRTNRQAFTLAEVLITISIIGVVAALTIPSMISTSKKNTYVIQLKQMYSMLSQALTQQKTDRQAMNLREAGLRTQADVEAFTKKHFRVMKECGGTKTPCFAASYKKLNGRSVATWNASQHYILAGGQSLGIAMGGCGQSGTAFRYYIDINGPKAPNIWGRDIMVFYVYNNGIVDDSTCSALDSAPLTRAQRNSVWTNTCAPTSNSTGIHGCLGYLLNNNWNMDYRGY